MHYSTFFGFEIWKSIRIQIRTKGEFRADQLGVVLLKKTSHKRCTTMICTFKSITRAASCTNRASLSTTRLLLLEAVCPSSGHCRTDRIHLAPFRRFLSITREAKPPKAFPQSGPQLPTPQLDERATTIVTTESAHIEETNEDFTVEEVNTADVLLNANQELTSIPWYLQVEAPKRAPKPLSERQRIPELPKFAPEILAPLLQQISVDLGMDDLSLLDLRHLDPPPALGANLIMIIGTARSEKHLHVSADRLCRWLRSNYKLRPDADGLLGRNELKLKLKRKARRAKLMGAKEGEGMDDGVRTGWVCVNVGTVMAPAVTQVLPVEDDFVGFGRRSDGVKIVVQMMVEEKREEIDLERLWTGISKRQLLAESEIQENEMDLIDESDENIEAMAATKEDLRPSPTLS